MREGQWQRFEIFDMLLTDADQKERIARIQQSIAEVSALTNDKSDECELPDVSPRKGQ